MKPLQIEYRFLTPDGLREVISLRLDPRTLELLNPPQGSLPDWTRPEFHRCTGCPIPPGSRGACPLAASLVMVVGPFSRMVSYQALRVEVETTERLVTQETTVENGISSLMGLLMATSGCPQTAFFRPMARFHLPLATREETLYRASSMYLLAQYFKYRAGGEPDLALEGLMQIYREVREVNLSIAERLRAASRNDAAVNALVLLDMFAMTLPMAIEESLDSLRYLFAGYLGESLPPAGKPLS